MTFEEVKAKIEKCSTVSIVDIKDIQYGRCISLSNGGKVNCFTSGKYSVQGKAQQKPSFQRQMFLCPLYLRLSWLAFLRRQDTKIGFSDWQIK